MAVVGFCPHIYQERNRHRILRCRRTLGRSPEDEEPDVARSSIAFPRSLLVRSCAFLGFRLDFLVDSFVVVVDVVVVGIRLMGLLCGRGL